MDNQSGSQNREWSCGRIENPTPKISKYFASYPGWMIEFWVVMDQPCLPAGWSLSVWPIGSLYQPGKNEMTSKTFILLAALFIGLMILAAITAPTGSANPDRKAV
jgi:hypothetical protein